MNILFIGNSYTYYHDMPTLFEQLAIRNQKEVAVDHVTKGCRRLADFATADETTLQLDALLATRTYDACFLQEQSVLPAAELDEFLRGMDCVVKKLQGRVEQLFLYATWGRKSGHALLAQHQWTTDSMTRHLLDAYQKAARLYDARVSAVGNCFLHVIQNHPEIELYHEDGSHPSYQGSCLAALTHYAALFHEFPKRTGTMNLNASERAAFRAAVCQTLAVF